MGGGARGRHLRGVARRARPAGAELGPIVRRVGSLRIPASEEEVEDCARQLEALRRHGLPARAADGPTGPGLFIPGDGSVQPLERCRLLARRALERGARLHCDTPALELAGDRVRTPAGEVACKAVVVCVDGGLEQLLPELDGQARSARLQMLATEPIAPGTIPCPVYDNWGYEYWQQLPDGSVALGGGRGTYAETEWGRPAEAGAEVQALLDRLLRERVGVEAAVTHRWAGVIAYTPDRLPVFAEVRPGVIAVGAHSGHGNVLGSAAARAAMAIALGGAGAAAGAAAAARALGVSAGRRGAGAFTYDWAPDRRTAHMRLEFASEHRDLRSRTSTIRATSRRSATRSGCGSSRCCRSAPRRRASWPSGSTRRSAPSAITCARCTTSG